MTEIGDDEMTETLERGTDAPETFSPTLIEEDVVMEEGFIPERDVLSSPPAITTMHNLRRSKRSLPADDAPQPDPMAPATESRTYKAPRFA
jgi:hypothetical protein